MPEMHTPRSRVADPAPVGVAELPQKTTRGVVDCDVHNGLAFPDDLKNYLPRRWHTHYDRPAGLLENGITIGARPQFGFYREDAKPTSGAQPGGDLQLLREQLLDRYDISRAILSPLEPLGWVQHGEFGRALHTALNHWMVAEWLDEDERLVGSISIASEDVEGAAQEIARCAADTRFVQVMMLAGTRDPLGHPRYWPIYEAAAEHGLPVAIHVGGFTGAQIAGGWVQYRAERHAMWPQSYQTHVVSLLCSSALERLPDLQFVLEESGVAWMPSLMWRLDRSWTAMRADAPYPSERPSDVIRKRFWFTTQPIDEPERDVYFEQMLDQLGMSDRIMFASDYPHWDFDPPDRVLRTGISADVRDKILYANAEGLYRFAR